MKLKRRINILDILSAFLRLSYSIIITVATISIHIFLVLFCLEKVSASSMLFLLLK